MDHTPKRRISQACVSRDWITILLSIDLCSAEPWRKVCLTSVQAKKQGVADCYPLFDSNDDAVGRLEVQEVQSHP